ncbi:MAG: Maf family protein [Gemmatimonadota bacterium]|nr:Maf family protein [Gemmatimonadota bacterium]MDH5758144.1 Maf family protein [Gemmatimonadota bacterium]
MIRRRVVLASASPRRREILDQLGVVHEVHPAHVDETYTPGETAPEHVERLARAKAAVVAEAFSDALVIGGDTVVVRDGEVLGKPSGVEDAVSTLLSLSGRSHTVLSGLAVSRGGAVFSGISTTEVVFREFGEETARAYAATGEPLDKAGAYGIQGLGAALVREIRGDYSTVVGFPVPVFIDLLARAGTPYTFHPGADAP